VAAAWKSHAPDQREQAARHHDECRRGLQAGAANETRGDERRRAAEQRERDVESQRDAAEADPRWKEIGQQHGKGAVDERRARAGQDQQQCRVDAVVRQGRVEGKGEQDQHQRPGAQKQAWRCSDRDRRHGQDTEGVNDDAGGLRHDGLARVVMQHPRHVRGHVGEEQSVETGCGREPEDTHKHARQLRLEHFT